MITALGICGTVLMLGFLNRMAIAISTLFATTAPSVTTSDRSGTPPFTAATSRRTVEVFSVV